MSNYTAIPRGLEVKSEGSKDKDTKLIVAKQMLYADDWFLNK